MYADMFASMGDELMQQRATDMRDIKARMQRVLMGHSVCGRVLPFLQEAILVAKDLTPSMTAGINPANVTGIVTELGGTYLPQCNSCKSPGDSCGSCRKWPAR